MARLVAIVLSVASGCCWIGALLLPWTARGTLSSASLLDAVELVRQGRVDSIVPSGAAIGLLVPALAGIVLVGVAGLRGRIAAALRWAALAVGAVASALLVWLVVDGEVSRLGIGAWVALAGVGAAVVAAVVVVAVVVVDRTGSPTRGRSSH
ncbi:hypothetical protein [Nocardioides sp. MH1]|uniref:hypothetical protein n=1 Tax=Nocardioides sp. MH1 TaxID=3242490 RepID=UPI003521AA99